MIDRSSTVLYDAPMKTQQFNVRLQSVTLDQINALCEALGCSQADVIRQAVRLLFRREGLSTQEKIPKKPKKDH